MSWSSAPCLPLRSSVSTSVRTASLAVWSPFRQTRQRTARGHVRCRLSARLVVISRRRSRPASVEHETGIGQTQTAPKPCPSQADRRHDYAVRLDRNSLQDGREPASYTHLTL